MATDAHAQEIQTGNRFEFGKNWQRFLAGLTENGIAQARASLIHALRAENLHNLRLLDAGSGSGLFSLAARRLGAEVYSFDYDPASVACTRELRRKYFGEDAGWTVETGSVLDREFLKSLGTFDIVYSWGVLHHTGDMWRAIENVTALVRPGGKLMLAIYNDQGTRSRRWGLVKRTYNQLPRMLRPLILLLFFIGLHWRPLLKGLFQGQPLRYVRAYGKTRGMTIWRDLEDWVGGYPYEVAKPEEIFDFCYDRGFALLRMRTTNSLGCNELVFQRRA